MVRLSGLGVVPGNFGSDTSTEWFFSPEIVLQNACGDKGHLELSMLGINLRSQHRALIAMFIFSFP